MRWTFVRLISIYRGVAQLVARTAGGREVAGSSPVTPTIYLKKKDMKTLKLDHDIAQLVLTGEKNVTWRMYDDKDISVNDELDLVDKVDPSNPATWHSIGTARVNVVVEKRLGDVDKSDVDGGENLASKDELLQKYQHYYGPQVTFDTPIKMIHFSMLAESRSKEDNVVNGTPKLSEAKLYADGGSRGNPGPSACGYAVMDMEGRVIVKKGVYLGVTTNNQAEYQSLKFGLEEALRMRVRTLHVYMDSMLVVNQMLGVFKVKNRDLWPIHEAIKELVTKFEHVSFTHVPRELNKIADKAVNDALDETAARQ